jgi:hypothetical protein
MPGPVEDPSSFQRRNSTSIFGGHKQATARTIGFGNHPQHAAPAPIPLARESFSALATTIGMRPNSRVCALVDPTLRASARALLRTFKKFNPQFARRQGKAALAASGSASVEEVE